MDFFKHTNHSKQITLEQGVMCYVTQDEMLLSVCTRVRGSEPESACVWEDFL